MTGWRLGYAAAPPYHSGADVKDSPVRDHVRSYHQPVRGCISHEERGPDVSMMRESYNQRRRFLLHAYEEMGLTCFEPMGAFYTFPNISRFGMTSEEFATRFLEEEKVAVVPGTAFGDCGEGFVRVSYAYSLDNLKEALGRMERFVKRLDGRE
ncbi:MAG: pyridoxal phosphate-dependent aminotransferase [Enterocloster bolteae]